MSSIVFSMNSFFSKPAQSIAPMLGVFFLNRNHYRDFKRTEIAMSANNLLELQDVMFNMLVLSSVILSSLQWIVFRDYSLKNWHKM